MDATRTSEAAAERTSDREITVTRTINGPARIVFDAWTRPELFERWWTPKSFPLTLLSVDIDARVGGTYRLEFRHEGSTFAFFGRYLEVTRPSLLVWTNDEDANAPVTTATFEETDGRTVVAVHERYPLKGSSRRRDRLGFVGHVGDAGIARATRRAARHHGRRDSVLVTALYTFDVFSTLDGYGSYGPEGDWGGYWGKDGPEFLDRRLALYREPQRLVLGANTMRFFMQVMGPQSGFVKDLDPVNSAMRDLPTTVASTTLEGPLDWPDATLLRADAVDVVARLREESDLPLRSHGSLSMNRALMAAGLVDRVQVTIFPVVSGRTGARPVFEGAADFDLKLIESRTLDGRTQELIYRPTRHG